MDKVLVVGAGVAGLQASLDLADFGHEVILVEKQPALGGNLKNLSQIFPEERPASELLANLVSKIEGRKNITVVANAEITNVEGEFPEFQVQLQSPNDESTLAPNAIILSTGFKPFDPSPLKQYGYGKLQDVITSLELEKMIQGRRLVRPSNSKEPNSITIIQCIGSRDQKTNTYCSSFCCMYAIKQATQIRQTHPEVNVTLLYMDIRTPLEGELAYRNARLLGVRFLRGKPAKVREANGTLMVQVEDTLENDLFSIESDIVVLSTGGVPDNTTTFFKDKLNLKLSDSGFIQIAERPVNTSTKGVFVAGAACGPKDIAYSMAQGSCAAAKVDIILKAQQHQ